MNKRQFLKTTGIASLASVLPMSIMTSSNSNFQNLNDSVDSNGKYQLPKLPYAYDALEPHIDTQTMTLHHTKHHQGYVNGLNTATDKIKDASEKGELAIIKHWERELAFNGGGHFLHTIFWNIMSPKQGNRSKEINQYIDKSFGSFDNFTKLFKSASTAVEGSGWGMLSYEPYSDKLIVNQVERHSNLTQWITIPLLVIDVWEHAYYLKYQNKRGDYIDAFLKIINWDFVSNQFNSILRMSKKNDK